MISAKYLGSGHKNRYKTYQQFPHKYEGQKPSRTFGKLYKYHAIFIFLAEWTNKLKLHLAFLTLPSDGQGLLVTLPNKFFCLSPQLS